MEFSFISLSIPLFFLLIGIEMTYSFYKKLGYYRLNDSISNLSQGTGQQVIEVFMKSLLFLGYIYVFDHLRLFTIGKAWYIWILLFIGVDFFYYWFHRMSHQVNALWAAHIVHHQSEEYNLTVALRQSWIQGWFSWIFYLPLAFIGFDPLMFLSISALVTLYQFWIHTKYIKNLGVLEHILNTPSHHRVHHGSNPKYIDKNHAGTFIIWDKLFGTFQKEEEEVRYGITKPVASWNPIWANFHYWNELINQAKSSPNFADKIKVFYKSPGWVPATSSQPIDSSQDERALYNPSYSAGIAPYVIVQFLSGLACGVLLVFLHPRMDSVTMLMLAGFTLSTLVGCGALLESKRWTFYFEIFRILFGFVLIYFSGLYETNLMYTIIFLTSSLIWFLFTITKRKIQ